MIRHDAFMSRGAVRASNRHVASNGFSRTRFEKSGIDGREVGAATCVYLDGEPVVDLWAGVADPDADLGWQ